jgi:hypothetical protein
MFPTALRRSNIVDSEYVHVRPLVPTGASPTVPSRTAESKEIKHNTGYTSLLSLGPSMASKSIRKSKSKRGAKMFARLPPSIDNTVTCHHVFRYSNSGASLVSASVADILGALGGVAITSTLFAPWASSFKIKSLRFWPSNSTSSNNTADVFWNSGTSGQVRDQEMIKSLPEGITETGCLVFKPPSKSLSSDWLAATATPTVNVFSMQAPAGSILDLSITFTLSNTFQAGNITLTAGTGGKIYYLALDGAASNLYPPLLLPSAH